METGSYKILIFSDTHGNLREIPFIKSHHDYDYLIYLGDGYEEVWDWVEKNNLRDKFIGVTGNCDFSPEVSRNRFFEIDSVRIFITHGDLFRVKESYDRIYSKAKEINANIVMFGHTHYADHQIYDNIHIFNPGSIIPRGRDFASVGYLEIQNGNILHLEHLTF